MEVLDIHSYIFRNAKETLKVISELFQGYSITCAKRQSSAHQLSALDLFHYQICARSHKVSVKGIFCKKQEN